MSSRPDHDEHSPYYERPSKQDSEAICAFGIIGALVIFALVALWKAYA